MNDWGTETVEVHERRCHLNAPIQGCGVVVQKLPGRHELFVHEAAQRAALKQLQNQGPRGSDVPTGQPRDVVWQLQNRQAAYDVAESRWSYIHD